MKKVMMTASSASILSAILTSACCLPALTLLAFSLGSVSLGATLARYHWWFLGAGSILLVYSYVLYFREGRACSTGGGCARPHKRLTTISLAVGTVVVLGLAGNSVLPMFFRGESVPPARAVVAEASSVVTTIPVEGMTCFSCELHVKKVLGEVAGVKEATPSATAGTVQVVYDPARVVPRALVNAINSKTGYKATVPENADAAPNKDGTGASGGETAHE